MRILQALKVALIFLVLVSCGEPVSTAKDARILILGDSMIASNRSTGQSVAGMLEATLGEDILDKSVAGARYFYALPISGSAGIRLTAQYRDGPWDWVVLNGGGNDLLFGCGCGKCRAIIDRLVSEDGRKGAIPAFVTMIRGTGAKVIYAGYLRNPGVQTPIKACGPAGNELDRRLTRMAQHDSGVTFLPMSDLVPYGDRSYHQFDLIHPSVKGSRAIAARIAKAMAP